MANIPVSYFKGPKLIKEHRAVAGSQTWKAGQFVRITDSGVVKCVAKGTAIYGIASQTISTAQTAGTKVYIEQIPSSSTQLVAQAYTTSAGAASAKANPANIGKILQLAVVDCTCGVSPGDSAQAIKIVDVYANKESFRNDTSDSVGLYIVQIPDSVLQAEGTGV